MSKTHVSILQELTVQRKRALPRYELLPSEGVGTHLPTFHYRVIVENIVAEGRAGSKREAKHDAAKNALETLCTKGVSQPTHVATPPAISSSSDSSPVHLQVNAIGALQDTCCKYNIPQPTYQLTAAKGPAHSPEFSVECKVAAWSTTASGSSKKTAKKLAAQEMLRVLMETLPAVSAESAADDSSSLLAAKSEYTFIQKKTDYRQQMSSYFNPFKAVMKEKNLTYETLWQDICDKDEVNLRCVLNKLGMDCSLEYMENAGNIIVTVTIDCQPAFVGYNIAASKEVAFFGAMRKTFQLLDLMSK